MIEEVKATYDELEQIATIFADHSQAIQQLLQKVQGSMDPLHNGGWIGRGSNAFFAEMQGQVIPATQRLQHILAEASQVTKQIAETMQKADEEASSRFRSTL